MLNTFFELKFPVKWKISAYNEGWKNNVTCVTRDTGVSLLRKLSYLFVASSVFTVFRAGFRHRIPQNNNVSRETIIFDTYDVAMVIIDKRGRPAKAYVSLKGDSSENDGEQK